MQIAAISHPAFRTEPAHNTAHRLQQTDQTERNRENKRHSRSQANNLSRRKEPSTKHEQLHLARMERPTAHMDASQLFQHRSDNDCGL